MGLRGQDGQRGYAMAALLVGIAVMGVLMSVAMPAYRHLTIREKEAELAFRGEQYARAIALYRAKNGNQFPPNIDLLVQGKYLRKKYKDPMTPDGEFRTVLVGNQAAKAPGLGEKDQPPQGQPAQTGGVFAGGGVMGVSSKSTATSIRIYKGQTRYDLWPFTFNTVNRPGGNTGEAAPGAGRGAQERPDVGRGGRGAGPGGRGMGPGGRGIGPGRGGRAGSPGGRGTTIIEPVGPPRGRGGSGQQPRQSPDS